MTSNDSWEYHNPTRIVFGGLERLPRHLDKYESILLVTTPGTSQRGVTDRVRSILSETTLTVFDEVRPNPGIQPLEKAIDDLSAERFDAIIGLGGGSAIDTAKIFSVRLHAEGRSFNLVDYVRNNRPCPELSPLPVTAIPTTHGTGSEVTPFATLWDEERGNKHSLSHDDLHPETALLDPALTVTLPKEQMISTALDALSQGLGSLWNKHATPITDLYAGEAVALVMEQLPGVLEDPTDPDRRGRLLRASLLAGMAISVTHTALAHSMSYPVTAQLGVPHGLACAYTLPAIWTFNQTHAPGQMNEVARTLGFPDPEAGRETLQAFLETVKLKDHLKKYVVRDKDLLELTDRMYTPERAGNNLVNPDQNQIAEILTDATNLWWP